MTAPHQPEPQPHDTEQTERRLSALTGMTPEAAQAYAAFHSGMRWLHPPV
jgi:hypothetical protein